jgi:hypothetical protein
MLRIVEVALTEDEKRALIASAGAVSGLVATMHGLPA